MKIKLICLLMVLMMALSFGACKKKETPKDENPPSGTIPSLPGGVDFPIIDLPS